MKKIFIVLSTTLLSLLITASLGFADLITLSLTGSWTAADFKTGSKNDSDGEVFGLAPYDGSLTVNLLVNTNSFVSYSAGYSYDYLGTTYTLSHDWFGYSDVTLVDGNFSFGNAVWDNSSILSLVGVDSLNMPLWTDTDISSVEPSRINFRMHGTYDGGSYSSDIFFGSRSPDTLGTTFLAWEYFLGDEIRADNFTPHVSPVPEPTTMLLFGTGLVGLMGVARRRKK